MCLVGYEHVDSVPGGGYFIVRNSWGLDWARESAIAPGYCRLPYAYLQQYAIVAYSISPILAAMQSSVAPATAENGSGQLDQPAHIGQQLGSQIDDEAPDSVTSSNNSSGGRRKAQPTDPIRLGKASADEAEPAGQSSDQNARPEVAPSIEGSTPRQVAASTQAANGVVGNYTSVNIQLSRDEFAVPEHRDLTLVVTVASDIVTVRFGGDSYNSKNLLNQRKLADDWATSPQKYGESLFRGIFNNSSIKKSNHDSTLAGFNRASAEAGGNLRIEISPPPDPADQTIWNYRWEYLREPNRPNRLPLACNESSAFYRRYGNSYRHAIMVPCLRVLVAVANPTTLGRQDNGMLTSLKPLNFDEQKNAIVKALAPLKALGVIGYTILGGPERRASAASLSEELSNSEYQILHIVAHGIQTKNKEFRLVLEAEDQTEDLLSPGDFCNLPVGKLQLVVLLNCLSNPAQLDRPLDGLGPQLLRRGIPAVIDMQDDLPVPMARFFAGSFYPALARHGSIDQALAETRLALYADKSDPLQRDWGIPALLMSSDHGELLKLPNQLRDKLDRDARSLLTSLVARADLPAIAEILANATSVVSPPVVSDGSFLLTQPQNRPKLSADLSSPVTCNAQKLREYVESDYRSLRLRGEVYSQLAAALNAGKHVILTGPPGTGKTELANKLCAYAKQFKFNCGTTSTTASADWSTFDTIGGLMPTPTQGLQFRHGIILQSIAEGTWLVIDEINRAEIDKAFGELFTILSGHGVTVPQFINGNRVRILPANSSTADWAANADTPADYVVHPNWRIIGTMNVHDKAFLFAMSYAFMRRFAFIYVDLPPDDFYPGLRASEHSLLYSWLRKGDITEKSSAADLDALEQSVRALLKRDSPLMQIRAIGPAIMNDAFDYIAARLNDDQPAMLQELLGEAFLLYIVPQFEGLDAESIITIYDYIRSDLASKLGDVAHQLILDRIQIVYPQIRREEWSR